MAFSRISARFSSGNVPAYTVVEQYLKLLVWVNRFAQLLKLIHLIGKQTVPVKMCNIININVWQFGNQLLVFVMTKLEPKPNSSLKIMA